MSTTDTLLKAEMKKMREMRSISLSLDSPDLGTMYTAAGKLMALPYAKSLLPKAMSLLDKGDATLRRLVYRSAGKNAYGKYVPELFESMKSINPAEREQVLQVIEEVFQSVGAPSSAIEQKRWIEALENVGHEHQSTIFGIIASLGTNGVRWAKRRIKSNIETISIGTIPKIASFPEKHQTDLIKIAIEASSKKKPELMQYLCEVADKDSIRFLKPVLENGTWQDRVHVARAVGRIGIFSSRGIVMDIVADPDWRVKQELLESIDIHESKLTSVLKILGYLVADSHSRVRGQADRTILLLGSHPCHDTDLDTQRRKLEKTFRVQLLRAAPNNKDINSEWLGVEIDDHPIPFISDDTDYPNGISLSDIEPKEEPKEEESSPKLDLMAALLKAKEDVAPKEPPIPTPIDESFTEEIEKSLPPTEKFMQILKKLAKGKKRGVTLEKIIDEASSLEMSKEEVEEALTQLEKDGIVYRSSSGTIKRVDIEF
ncbi:MAG: HEAT repeat domain-containing protein [Candidatus Thorarchaeota archaeon]